MKTMGKWCVASLVAVLLLANPAEARADADLSLVPPMLIAAGVLTAGILIAVTNPTDGTSSSDSSSTDTETETETETASAFSGSGRIGFTFTQTF